LIVEHAGMKLPIWLNEGLADLYSSLEPRGDQTMVGRPLEGHLQVLAQQKWLDLNLLTSVQQNSPYYNERDKMAIFYAQSWALTHMLALSQDYAGAFPKFVELISSGVSARESLAKIYSKSPDQVMMDLRAYLSRRQLPTHVFDLDLVAAEVEPQSLATAREQADLALADLAASNVKMEAAGAAALNSFSGRYPDSPEAEESLGYLALRHNRIEEARLHFQKAVDRHSTAPDVIFYLAHLDASAGAPPDRVIALLNRALEINPGYYEARLELGLVAARAKKFEIAAAALTAAVPSGNKHPEHAYVVSYTLAYCYAQLHQPERAFEYAEKAAHAVRNSQDEEQTANLLRYIDRQRLSAAALAVH